MPSRQLNQFSVTLSEGQLIAPDYTISFDTCGGSSVATRYLNEGESLSEEVADPVKDGYTFCGWDYDDEPVDLADFTMPAANIILTAKWEEKEDILYGDVDDNDIIEAKDALMALQAAVKKVTLTGQQQTVADVNGDGIISAADALYILQRAVNKLDKFPVEK